MAAATRSSGKAQAEFDFLQEVGRGSYGVVTKAVRKRDGKVCVVKSVLLERLGTERERTLALNEAKIMKDLSCPHIVEYLDAFCERGTLYLILQFCELGNLKAHYLRSTKAISMPKVWRIGLRIALGLEYLHARRILHRDIKSENILLMPEDEVRIADLGLAKQLSSSMIGATTMCGTPRYLSPEMAKGNGPYSAKCDMWALGIILYEMCSANHTGPFLSNTLGDLLQKIQHQEVPPLPKRTDAQMRDLVVKLLEKEPLNRPAASELLALPSVRELGSRHGVLEPLPAPDVKDTPGSMPSSSETCQERPSRESGGLSDGSGGLIYEREVPDGFCAKLGWALGRGSEPGLGPRFHRLGYCELCAAEGLPNQQFDFFRRRHHCRNCGRSVCAMHCGRRQSLPHFGHTQPQRICDLCSLIPGPGCEGNHGQSNERTRPWILTARSGSQALAWDSRSLTANSWSVPEKLHWMGHGHDGAGAVICTLGTQAGACLQMRALETGEVLKSAPLPLDIGGAATTDTAPDRPAPGNFMPPSRTTARLSRAATIDAAACCGEWFAVARRDWANSFVHVLGLSMDSRSETTNPCLGYCVVRDKATAMALQDGPNGFLATAHQSGEVSIWAVPGADEPCPPITTLEGHRQAVTCIAVTSNPTVLCTGSPGCLRLWRRQSSGVFLENTHPKACDDHAATGSAAISCAGTLLAFVRKPKEGTWEKGVSLWDLGFGRFEHTFFKKGHSVGCVALCGNLLATSDAATSRGGCTVQLWHAHTGTPLAVFRNPSAVNLLLVAASQPPKPPKSRLRLQQRQ